MNRLNCEVRSCRHNEDCLCDLNKINVEGPGAHSTEQTCCASFAGSGTAKAQNGCGKGCSASSQTSIDCKAEACTYNESCKCTADTVSVGCCCSTPCVMSETECCTFKSR